MPTRSEGRGDTQPRCTTIAAVSSPPPRSRPTRRTPPSRNAATVVDRLERPEAVDDADLEPAAQERAVAPAQEAVLGQVAAEARDVVAAVVMEDEQAAARSQDAGRLGDLGPRSPRNAVHRLTTTSAEASGASIARRIRSSRRT